MCVQTRSTLFLHFNRRKVKLVLSFSRAHHRAFTLFFYIKTSAVNWRYVLSTSDGTFVVSWNSPLLEFGSKQWEHCQYVKRSYWVFLLYSICLISYFADCYPLGTTGRPEAHQQQPRVVLTSAKYKIHFKLTIKCHHYIIFKLQVILVLYAVPQCPMTLHLIIFAIRPPWRRAHSNIKSTQTFLF